ncbi:uncharacterized protein RJT21DRAFT_6326 [Scheffersomyces amazonensis]|uniref:uncharacterized protein n=1 Tax=Scheffersomyces amazonensis TaxID=1078765 RepID=UPI00315CE57E
MSEINPSEFNHKLKVSAPIHDQSIPSSPSLSPSPPPTYEHSQANIDKNVPRFTSRANSPHLRRNDEDLVSAAEALTQLNRSVTPPNSSTTESSSDDGQLATPKEPTHENTTTLHPLVTRVNQVSKHPLVTNAVKYYESTKRNYASFGYAADIVEKTAIPVVTKIEDNLNTRHQKHLKNLEAKKKKKDLKSSSSASPSSSGSTPSEVNSTKRRRTSTSSHHNSLSVSLETKNRIQFCLHILRLANDSINNKVTFLQQKVSAREEYVKSERERIELEHQQQQQQQQQQQPSPELENTDDALQTKTEIVTTVKKIIRLISNFRPSSLSTDTITPVSSNTSEDNELKSTIRDIILNLPNSFQQSNIANSTSAKQANDRIIVFAKESLEMIAKLTNVLNEQLVKAEDWVAGAEEEQLKELSKTQEESESDIIRTSSQSTIEEPTEEFNSVDTKRIKIQDSENVKMIIDN